MNKRLIGGAFGAALRYDDEAHVQREVAQGLAAHIAGLPVRRDPRLLEIGCGTGLLTSALVEEGLSGDWVVSDLSPVMAARCREGLGGARGHFRYVAMDGERPCFAPDVRFDLVCSSLAFQWFHDLEGAVATLCGLIAPGGHLAFTTLAEGSFDEWRAAHRIWGLKEAVPAYPSVASLRAMAPGGHEADIFDFRIQPRFADAKAFLGHLRGLGAHVPKGGAAPLSPGALRRVMRVFEDSGAAATYHVAVCTFRKLA
ncbi:hypothetical protein BSL82_02600 [Tardibacter chloracetimidivorans]|uniref:Methyltransferase type 11 domain-containing protein n=1 Tax=Tardibacter chloracetimidivorans TaxID=1921510 RepID=A0A1L3ZRS5_9SPHN|nr:methyltransferase domain-containing protein [Tardibacter chloracetimidivorans]API58334.1 hypothetical protein BSL82_02600 [Tardibacter chloracetimidivorans]